jgi:hypothetical protein
MTSGRAHENMGTSKEWVHVLLTGGFWGGWMVCWDAYRRHAAGLKPVLRIVDLFSLALAAAWFGIGATFGWRAFHRPLVFIMTAPIVVILVLLVRRSMLRRKIHTAG